MGYVFDKFQIKVEKHQHIICSELKSTSTCTVVTYIYSEFWIVQPRWWRGVLHTTLCDKICQWLATGWWFSLGTLVSSTYKTDCHDITEILLNVALNTITPYPPPHPKECWLKWRCRLDYCTIYLQSSHDNVATKGIYSS